MMKQPISNKISWNNATNDAIIEFTLWGTQNAFGFYFPLLFRRLRRLSPGKHSTLHAFFSFGCYMLAMFTFKFIRINGQLLLLFRVFTTSLGMRASTHDARLILIDSLWGTLQLRRRSIAPVAEAYFSCDFTARVIHSIICSNLICRTLFFSFIFYFHFNSNLVLLYCVDRINEQPST